MCSKDRGCRVDDETTCCQPPMMDLFPFYSK